MPEILATSEKLSGFPKNCFFSENMKQGEFGLGLLYKHNTLADSSSLSALDAVKAFADMVMPDPNNNGPITSFATGIAAQDANGLIFARQMGQNSWSELYKPGHASPGIGILWDGAYLYYMGTEHIGRAQTHVQNKQSSAGFSDYEGTVSVTNGSTSVTGSGTSFNAAAQNGKRIKIGTTWYTIASIASATSLTLASAYTGPTASGVSYRIFTSWQDAWQDCGDALTGYNHFQPFMYEGDILIPRKDRISRYNRTDASFNNDGSAIFNAPDGFYWRCGAGGPNGILLAMEAAQGNASYLVLWNNFSLRSSAPWIPLNSKVQAIQPYATGWIVVTEREILFSNGYSSRVLSRGFHTKMGTNTFSVIPNGLRVVDDRVVIANAIGGYSKTRSGVYVYDIPSDSYDYIAPLGGHTYNVTPWAVFVDINKAINVSYTTTEPAQKYLATISDDAPSRGYVITKPLAHDGDSKHLSGIKASFAIPDGSDSITGSITAKAASINRRIWGIQKAKLAGSQTNQITVDGTALSDVQAGDEITIMEGANAGLTRHISSITGAGTATELWTLDSALTSNIEANAYISVTPFQKIAMKSVSSQAELRDMFFNAQNRLKGKQYLVKLAFADFTVPIEVLELGLIAQDQGPRT
jgi:hypothetical protein